MSNTPKGKMTLPTTKPNQLDIEWYVQECAWMQVELGKLKTENAALLRLIEDPNAMHAHYLRHLPGWEVWSTERVRNMDRDNARLERENAKLLGLLSQWLKMADDCHAEQLEVGYSEYNVTVGLLVDTRSAIDAARKEAQP